MEDERLAPILLTHYHVCQPLDETLSFVKKIIEKQAPSKFKLYLTVPLFSLEEFSKAFSQTSVSNGAEMMLSVDEESFTSSISLQMLQDLDAQFVLIGSQAELKVYSSSTESLNKKLRTALASKILPIICIGETAEEHESTSAKALLVGKMKELLKGLTPEELDGLHLLYEATWINRTPWEANHEELQNGYRNFREALLEAFPPDVVEKFRLILAIPTYSPDLHQLLKTLPADGYSLGTLEPLSTNIDSIFPLG